MEGAENNPMMFELMCELPWRPEKFTKEEWLKDYLFARYGVRDEKIEKAWTLLANTIYNCPFGNNQQGPHESIFCGRPSLNNFQASSWSKMKNYYDPTVTEEAARLMVEVADKYRGNNNFEYDLVDIVRQSLSDKGRIVYNRTIADFKSF
ncbi:MAG: alpha-N-acetylglucosaminidase C-terminal domain-containing protein [Bacteroides cellulosilyticus]